MKQGEKKQIVKLKEELATFFENNTASDIKKTKKGYYIVTPWNDNSIRFLLEKEYQAKLINVLNNIILSPRFTAIYHSDTKTMEYIYTILETDDLCFSRQFEFALSGKKYHCKFAESSECLLLLSQSFRRTRNYPQADYRNLLEYREYMEYKSGKQPLLEDYFTGMVPISFYVSKFNKFDETEILQVSQHLNFFMQYYDRDCPIAIIHPVEIESTIKSKQLKLIDTTFPKSISSRKQDPFLLELALEALKVKEIRLQYIYYYQILEYAAFYYIDHEIRRHLLKLINSPDIQSYPEKYLPSILEKVTELNQGEDPKIDRIVQVRCEPEVIWREIQQNRDFFLNKQEFDGGHVMDCLITEDMTIDSFIKVAWHPNVIKNLRNIRNALVHGREKRVSQIISPSKQNDLKLRPLVNLIRRIAEQVIIYDKVV